MSVHFIVLKLNWRHVGSRLISTVVEGYGGASCTGHTLQSCSGTVMALPEEALHLLGCLDADRRSLIVRCVGLEQPAAHSGLLEPAPVEAALTRAAELERQLPGSQRLRLRALTGMVVLMCATRRAARTGTAGALPVAPMAWQCLCSRAEENYTAALVLDVALQR